MATCTTTSQYILEGDRLDILDWPGILAGAGRLGTITVENHHVCSFTVADTYAATVLAGGLLLACDKSGNQLVACTDLLPQIKPVAGPVAMVEAAEAQTPCTTELLFSSPYRSKHHEGWKLLPLGELLIDTTEFMCRNSAEKGVARLWRVSLKASRQVQLIYFAPLRGYEREARSYYRFFRYGAGLSRASANHYPFHTALGLREPLPPHGTIDLYKPAASILRRRMQTYALEAFWQNNGIIHDADPECLHQFRVELRKMRSLISLHKPLLTSYHRELKAVLAALMSRTNALRDLDVLMDSRRELVRACGKDDDTSSTTGTKPGKNCQALFKRIAAARAVEQAAISIWLESEETKSNIRRTMQLLKKRSPIWKRPRQAATMATLLPEGILAAYTKIKATTLGLSPTATPAEIHTLRILHKHLRYLLDFSMDLKPDQTTSALLGILKISQKYMGDYNDAVVQLEWFRSWGERLAGVLTVPEEDALVLLITTIEDRVAERCTQAIDHASECISPETEALLHALAYQKEP